MVIIRLKHDIIQYHLLKGVNMSQLSLCTISFIEKTLTDIGVSQIKIADVISGLNRSITVYNKNTPSTSPESIILNLYECSKTQLNDSIDQLVQEVLQLQIFISVILSIAVLIIILSLFYLPSRYVMIVIIFILIVAVIISYFIYNNYLTNISSILESREKNINVCVNTAKKDIQTYAQQQEDAINAGLCAY